MSGKIVYSLKVAWACLATAGLIWMFNGSLAGQTQTKVKTVPTRTTYEVSGKTLFTDHCAACHGQDGKGKGPALPALKVPPPDLTQLAKQNGGIFPSSRVQERLMTVDVASHGSSDMPVWGPVFRQMSPNHDLRIVRATNVTKYIESIQEKPESAKNK